jgi:integrase
MPSSAPTGAGFIAKEREIQEDFVANFRDKHLARIEWLGNRRELRISTTVGILLYGSAKTARYFAVGVINVGQQREGRWVLDDLEGKGRRIRTVAIPIWVKQGINAWMIAAGIEDGRLLRSVSKSGRINRDTLSDWAVWSVVEQSSKQIGIEHFGAHDLRRTCAKLCRKNGGDLEQIKFLLGHSSIQTTERYVGSEQNIEIAVNDNLGL